MQTRLIASSKRTGQPTIYRRSDPPGWAEHRPGRAHGGRPGRPAGHPGPERALAGAGRGMRAAATSSRPTSATGSAARWCSSVSPASARLVCCSTWRTRPPMLSTSVDFGAQSELRLGFAALHRLVLPYLGRLQRLSRSASRCAGGDVRPQRGPAAEPIPGEPGRAGAAVRCRRVTATDVPDRRRAVAGPGIACGAGVRRAPAVCRPHRHGVQCPRRTPGT